MKMLAFSLITLAVAGAIGPIQGATEPEPAVGDPTTRRPHRVVWVALEGAEELVKVDLTLKKVIARRSVPGAPHNLSISPTGKTIGSTLWSNGKVILRRKGAQVSVNLGGAPHDLKIGGGRVIVSNQTEARLDLITPTGRFLRSIGLKTDPHDLALRRKGRQAWVTLEGSDELAVVSIRSGGVRYISTGQAPHDIQFAPDGRLWVSDWNGAIHVFSKRGRRLKTIPIGIEAHHLVFTPDGRQVWISDNAARRIFVIRTKTYRVVKRFQVQGAPHHITITPDGDRAIVADHDRGQVVVFNINKMKRSTKIRVGSKPHGIWALP